jgi:hypothetical protein
MINTDATSGIRALAAKDFAQFNLFSFLEVDVFYFMFGALHKWHMAIFDICTLKKFLNIQ